MNTVIRLIWKIRQYCNPLHWKIMLIGFVVWLTGVSILWFLLPYQTQLFPYQSRFKLPGTENSVFADFSENGRILATAPWVANGPPWMGNGPICIWDMQTGKEIAAYLPRGELAASPGLSGDGRILMVETLASGGAKNLFSFVDTESAREVFSITDRDRRLRCLPPDGKTFILMREKAEFWDISTGRKRLVLNCWPACFSPDSQWFISKESESELRVRSMATGEIKLRIPCQAQLLECGPMFSPDGTLIAADRLHEEVMVWDASTGREVLHLNHSCVPRFTRDGKRLGVLCPGGIKVWDTTTWQQFDEMAPFASEDESITWLPGPGPDDFLLAYSKDQLSRPGRVDELKFLLGMQNRRSLKNSTEMNVFVFPPWSQVAEFCSNGGKIHFSPDGKSFVEDSGSSPVFPKQPRECIKIYDLPLRTPLSSSQSLSHIVLWPVPIACLTVLIGWALVLRRERKRANPS
jgi:WD40 repeat protein